MIDVLNMLLAAIVGGVLALSYFGGLWWTVRQLPAAQHPSAMYFGSLALRLALLMAGLFVVLVFFGGLRLVACLVGFLVTRLVVVHLVGHGATSVWTVERGT